MTIKRAYIASAAFVSALAFAQVEAAYAGLAYEGSSTMGETIITVMAPGLEAKTGVKIDKVGGAGVDKGIKAVMEGAADVAGVARALTREEKKNKLYAQTIGYDAIAVFVNAKNPVKKLSKAQLKGIFTGKIANWKEVGGANAKIVVVTEAKASGRGTYKVFKEVVLDNTDYGTAKEIEPVQEGLKYVSTDENAIVAASASLGIEGVKYVAVNDVEPVAANIKKGSYLLSRPMLLVSKTLPSGDLKKLFEYVISPEGQAIVSKKFVPIK